MSVTEIWAYNSAAEYGSHKTQVTSSSLVAPTNTSVYYEVRKLASDQRNHLAEQDIPQNVLTGTRHAR